MLAVLPFCHLALSITSVPTSLHGAFSARRPALIHMAATDTAAVATSVVAATVTAAEEYAVKAGAGSAGDLFGIDGIEPVLSAALAAASTDAALASEVQRTQMQRVG